MILGENFLYKISGVIKKEKGKGYNRQLQYIVKSYFPSKTPRITKMKF